MNTKDELIKYYRENFNTTPPEKFLNYLESSTRQIFPITDMESRMLAVDLMVKLEEVQNQLDDAEEIIVAQKGAIENVIVDMLNGGE